MKALRRFCAASLLTLALTLPVSAGYISTGVTSPPPPPAPASAPGDSSTSVAGEISTTKSEEATANDSVTEIALNLIQSVLSLF